MVTITQKVNASGNLYYTVTIVAHDGSELGEGYASVVENAWGFACEDAQDRGNAAGKSELERGCPFPADCTGADCWTPEEAWAAAA